MKELTLKIKETHLLKAIGKTLNSELPLTKEQRAFLVKLCSKIPETKHFLEEKPFLEDTIQVNLLDIAFIEENLKKWQALFENIPGFDFAPYSYVTIEQGIIGDGVSELLAKGVLIVATFSPCATYGLLPEEKDGIDVYLKDDGTAMFSLLTQKNVEQYPELYTFKGSWKEAYLLMIETIKRGWPMEGFPKELQGFLPK